MRRLVLERGTRSSDLFEALATPSPLELVLVSPPAALGRSDLVAGVARSEALLFTTFSATLATPLAEVALLSAGSSWKEGALLDLSDALLTPLIARVGLAGARRLLGRGPVLDPVSVLPRWRGPAGRSAGAVRVVTRLLASPSAPRELLAEERAAFQLVMTLADRAEGIRAFAEKRPPRFDW